MTDQTIDLTVGVKPAVRFGPTSIEYTVYPDGSVSVDTVKTPIGNRREGWARKAMKSFLALTAGRPVFLTAEPIGKDLSVVSLVCFYRSLGFQWMTGAISRRYPICDHFRMARLSEAMIHGKRVLWDRKETTCP